VHRIFETPLNIHFDAPALAWIFDRLGINIIHANGYLEIVDRVKDIYKNGSSVKFVGKIDVINGLMENAASHPAPDQRRTA
jgi:UDP-N-acetylglucosamine:LPS N-acetylglucosamine transferase